jgi:histidinol phosphatase-like enzyme
MILGALSDPKIERSRGFFVGEDESDIERTDRAGIPGFLFISSNLVACLNKCLAEIGLDMNERW